MRAGMLVCLLAASCDGGQPVHELDPSLSRMMTQRRADPFAMTPVFENGMVMRVPPRGTRTFAPTKVMAPPLDRAAFERGRVSYDTFCAVCHGVAGDGESVVAQKMKRRPPAFTSPDIASLQLERIADVIANGYGLMPPFATKLDEPAREEVTAYVLALRLSRSARVAALPPDVREELAREPP